MTRVMHIDLPDRRRRTRRTTPGAVIHTVVVVPAGHVGIGIVPWLARLRTKLPMAQLLVTAQVDDALTAGIARRLAPHLGNIKVMIPVDDPLAADDVAAAYGIARAEALVLRADDSAPSRSSVRTLRLVDSDAALGAETREPRR